MSPNCLLKVKTSLDSWIFLIIYLSVNFSEANDLTTIFNLRQKFLEYNLIFDYAFKESNVNEKDMQQLLQTILIVVVAVLGTLCILLFAAFVVRTRR